MIRQNRAVPILSVITIAWVLYVAGCFGGEEPTTAAEELPTTVPTVSPEPIVTAAAADAAARTEEPFVYTIEDGDLLPTIAAKFNVTQDVILRANPDLNPNVLIAGATLRIPGATTVNTIDEDRSAAREAGESIDYVVEDGDNLGAIANSWQVSLSAILEANPEVVPESLQIGQLLVIPPRYTGLSPDEVAALSPPTPVERPPGEVLYHTVQPGELLSTLADLYSVTVGEIMAANALDNPDQISIGQELAIPPPSQTVEPQDSAPAPAAEEATGDADTTVAEEKPVIVLDDGEDN